MMRTEFLNQFTQLRFLFGRKKANPAIVLPPLVYQACRIGSHLAVLDSQPIREAQQRTIAIQGRWLQIRLRRKPPLYVLWRDGFCGTVFERLPQLRHSDFLLPGGSLSV